MTDESTADRNAEQEDAANASRGRPPKHKSENYGDAEFLDDQSRLTDLVPRRMVAHVLLLKLGAALIVGLVMLSLSAPRFFSDVASRPAAVMLGAPGSLSNWFSSLLLLAAGFLAIVNFAVRRHRMDDYRGRYRVWLWAAACWFLMATDVATGLHQALRQAMIAWTHTPLVGDGTIWWLGPTVLVLGAMGTWLAIDVRSCRLACTSLILAGVAYITATVAFVHGVRLPSELAELLVVQISLLAGHLLVAWAMAINARFVLLDAEGRLPRRGATAKPKRQRMQKPKGKADNATASRADAADKDGNSKWIAIDQPHGSGAAALKRAGAPASAGETLGPKVGAVVSHAAASSSLDESKLNKADRKAMKKKMLDDRLRSEQRKASNW